MLPEEQLCRLLTYFLLQLPEERSEVGLSLLEGRTGQLALWWTVKTFLSQATRATALPTYVCAHTCTHLVAPLHTHTSGIELLCPLPQHKLGVREKDGRRGKIGREGGVGLQRLNIVPY